MAGDTLPILGQGENFAVDYSNDGGNILGGGPVTVIGHGDSAEIRYSTDRNAQHGRMPHVISQGEEGQVTYTDANQG